MIVVIFRNAKGICTSLIGDYIKVEDIVSTNKIPKPPEFKTEKGWFGRERKVKKPTVYENKTVSTGSLRIRAGSHRDASQSHQDWQKMPNLSFQDYADILLKIADQASTDFKIINLVETQDQNQDRKKAEAQERNKAKALSPVP